MPQQRAGVKAPDRWMLQGPAGPDGQSFAASPPRDQSFAAPSHHEQSSDVSLAAGKIPLAGSTPGGIIKKVWPPLSLLTPLVFDLGGMVSARCQAQLAYGQMATGRAS